MSRSLIVEDEVASADLEKDYLELSGFEAVSYTHLPMLFKKFATSTT